MDCSFVIFCRVEKTSYKMAFSVLLGLVVCKVYSFYKRFAMVYITVALHSLNINMGYCIVIDTLLGTFPLFRNNDYYGNGAEAGT